MKLNVLRADPAGNITLFVLTPVERAQRAEIAAKLMQMERFAAEQVGFISDFSCLAAGGEEAEAALLEGEDKTPARIRMDMMGGEFCGNATRAFGMLVAKLLGKDGIRRLSVSGCDHPVTVETDLKKGTSRAEMPLPKSIREVHTGTVAGTLVDLSGIAHLIVQKEPSTAYFSAAEPLFQGIKGLEAYGVIFLADDRRHMTPLVKVVETNTLVFEGSCGSGSLAAAVSESEALSDGIFQKSYAQPAGEVEATVVRKNGAVTEAYIGGSVILDEPVEVEITLSTEV